MCGAEKGLVAQIYKACENIRCLKLVVIHCSIYSSADTLQKMLESIMKY